MLPRFHRTGFLLILLPVIAAWLVILAPAEKTLSLVSRQPQLPFEFPLPDGYTLSLRALNGSVWSGRAPAATLYRDSVVVATGSLDWQLEGHSLLLGNLCMNLNFAGASASLTRVDGRACYRPAGDLEIAVGHFELPAALMLVGSDLQLTGTVQGVLDISTNTSLDPVSVSGAGAWQQAAVATSEFQFRIGELPFTIESLPGRLLQLTFRNTDPPSPVRDSFAIDMTTLARIDGSFNVEGLLVAPGDVPAEVLAWLQALASGRTENRFHFQFQSDNWLAHK